MTGLATLDVRQLLSDCKQSIVDLGPSQALDRFLQRHAPGELVRAVLVDDQLLRRAADESYRHANGFDKLILASTPLGHTLKMDVWWPEDPRGQEDVHNHRYDFSSHVIAGALFMEHYEACETGVVMDHLRVEMAGRTDHLHRLDQQTVERRFAVQLPAGGTYSLHHAQLHRVTVDAGALTATLAFQGRTAQQVSDVYRLPGSDRGNGHYYPPFSVTGFKERLERLTAAMDLAGLEQARA